MDDQQMDDLLAKQLAIVEESGWVVTGVFDPDGKKTPFTYTAGLSQKTGVEIVIVGLDPYTSQELLNEVGKRLVAGDLVLEANVPVPEVILNYDVTFVRLPSTNGFGMAKMLAPHLGVSEFEPWQMLWPDPNNMLPNSTACEERFVTLQLNDDLDQEWKP